jgi:ankyrin repeat protein
VRRTLDDLPVDLDTTYERILENIPSALHVDTHRLLQCLTAAVRPLAVEELAEVLAIDFDGAGGIPKLNRNFRWADQEQAVLSACSSLVIIVNYQGSRRVQFSHLSVKEFLSLDRLASSENAALRFHRIDLESAHATMAQACLGVLLQLDDRMDKKTIEGYPLAKYAGKFFVDHAKAGDVLSQNNDGVDHLLDPDRRHLKPWFWLQCGDTDQKGFDVTIDSSPESGESSSEKSSSDHRFPEYPPRMSPLYYTLRLGHQYLTRHLILERPHDLNLSDVYGRTPLHLATYRLDIETTRMLLDRKADINARDKRGWTPLHYAMAKLDQDKLFHYQDDVSRCLRLLLKRGADPEAQNNRDTTPLHLAASYMNRKNVRILIVNVTNINMRNDQGQTALHKASRRGAPGVIRIILNYDADVDAQDNGGSTPLHLAIFDAPSLYAEQAIGVLLEHGANINLRNHEGQTTLHKASRRSNIGIMRLILMRGPDVNALDNNGSTPLHLAISGPAVELLLEHRANVNLQNGQRPDCTATSIATWLFRHHTYYTKAWRRCRCTKQWRFDSAAPSHFRCAILGRRTGHKSFAEARRKYQSAESRGPDRATQSTTTW